MTQSRDRNALPAKLHLVERSHQILRCSWCREKVGQEAWRCELCQSALHKACSREAPNCPTLGCNGATLPLEILETSMVCADCREDIQLGAWRCRDCGRSRHPECSLIGPCLGPECSARLAEQERERRARNARRAGRAAKARETRTELRERRKKSPGAHRLLKMPLVKIKSIPGYSKNFRIDLHPVLGFFVSLPLYFMLFGLLGLLLVMPLLIKLLNFGRVGMLWVFAAAAVLSVVFAVRDLREKLR